MWVAPMPKKLLKQNDFVLKTCKDKKIPYVDYLIYRKGYILSKEDKNSFIDFINQVNDTSKEYDKIQTLSNTLVNAHK